MANNGKQVGSSSSSSDYLNEIFGIKQHPDSPASVLAILSPKSKDSRENTSSVLSRHMPMYHSGSQVWNRKQENISVDRGANKENKSTFQQRSEHPCPLSSSIYYGSQEDMYVKSSSAPASKSHPSFYKDENEDSLEGVSTKDESAAAVKWWEGSLYY